jgi:CheY-like chemotaxis protein
MSRRILLADDSVTIQKVIELTFMDEDFEVSAVSNGDEAVRLLPELRPELVIADVHMPGANGYEVCRRSKALDPHVPVLLLVGTFEPFDEGQSRSAGSDAFLKKPFDSQELLQLVQGLLDKAGPEPAAAPAPVALETPMAPVEAPRMPELAAEAPWGSFELEAEPEPPAAPAAPATSAGFAWSSPNFTPDIPELAAPVDEPLFELEPTEDLALDESFLPAEEPFSLEDGGLGATEFAEVPAPTFPAGLYPPATPEERVGVPLGAAPLAGSLGEVEHRIESHAADHDESGHKPLPDLPSPTPPPSSTMPVGSVSLRSDRLSDEEVDRIARRLVELLGDKVVRDVAWEVVPDLAEVVIKDRLRELESQVE